jgi:colicin import membrane protein
MGRMSIEAREPAQESGAGAATGEAVLAADAPYFAPRVDAADGIAARDGRRRGPELLTLIASAALHAAAIAAVLSFGLRAVDGPEHIEIPVELVSADAMPAAGEPAGSSRPAPAAVADIEVPPPPELASDPELTARQEAKESSARPQAPAAGDIADPAVLPPPELASDPDFATPPEKEESVAQTKLAEVPERPMLQEAPLATAPPPKSSPSDAARLVVRKREIAAARARAEAAERHEEMRKEQARRAATERRGKEAAEARAEQAAERAKRETKRRAEASRAAQTESGRERMASLPANGGGGAARGGARASAASAPSSAVAGNYRGQVIAHLVRFKRYPEDAEARGAEGRPTVSFSLDAGGRVGGVSLSRSSGHRDIDAETLAMVRRASPFPVPPAGAPRSFSVTIHFGVL